MKPRVLSRDEARWRLVSHFGLNRVLGRGASGSRAVLERLRCVQLDPLDCIGTNGDLVIMARVDGVSRGDLWQQLFPRHAFEHFAKERCILPAESFAWYAREGHVAQTPWWRHTERVQRVPETLVQAVLAEVRERGRVTAKELTDHGAVVPMDWSGWMGTAKATTMALEILWTRCEIVVAGRDASGSKYYDLPERALGAVATRRVEGDFQRWALGERVKAAGLLTRAGCASWSILSGVRTSTLPDEMLEAGELEQVALEGSSRMYLTTAAFLRQRAPRYDDRVRILGPLDPLIWDRDLVRLLFDFDYVWEVYKPESQRKWGWYVCPLLWRDQLVGRLDARVVGKTLEVRKLWLEREVEMELVMSALERQAELCGATKVKMPRGRWRRRAP